jgi:hypothetical protein
LCGIVFFGVLGQTAWMLRPFFGRPAQRAVPFVRAREGSFADAVVRSSKSAAGVYEPVSKREPIHEWLPPDHETGSGPPNPPHEQAGSAR